MDASGHFESIHDESQTDDDRQRKHSTRDLNGSYILACRGEDSLECSSPPSPISHQSREQANHDDHTVYISIATDDSDEELSRCKLKRSRVISDSIADRSLPNPANIASGEQRKICISIPDLSTLPNPDNSRLSDAPICRICHEGDEAEDLVSPCFCSGSVGALHMSCLEKWLGTANMTRCEICEFEFTVSKNPKPFSWFLMNKSLGKDRRYLIADILCAVIFIPLTLAVFIGCLVGASYFSSHDKDWQAVTLILVAMTSLLILCLWCGFTLRRNYIICSTWREHFREVKIKYSPPEKNYNRQPFNREASMSGRKLLEKSYPTPKSYSLSPELPNRTITRKITYETSPSYLKDKREHVDAGKDDDRCTLKPGTPHIRKKRQSPKNDGSMLTEGIRMQELMLKDEHMYKSQLDRIKAHSTSTPARKGSRVDAFDERRCSATPIHRLPYIAVPLQTYETSHPGMFVDTPYSIVHPNRVRKGLLVSGARETSENHCSIPPDGLNEQ